MGVDLSKCLQGESVRHDINADIDLFLCYGTKHCSPYFVIYFFGTETMNIRLYRSHPLTFAALAIVVMAYVVIFAVSVEFFFVPVGNYIRPMGWALLIGEVSFVTLLLAMPVGILAIAKERLRLLAIISLIVSITPFFFGTFLLRFAAWVRGFRLAD